MKTPIHVLYLEVQGRRDARRGIRPNQLNKHYLNGWAKQYAREAMQVHKLPF